MAVLEGIKYGLILTIMIGPSFFYLIRISLIKGFTKAVAFAVGILLTDILFVFSIFFGLSKLFQNTNLQIYASLVGGIILIVMGLQYLKSSKKHDTNLKDAPKSIKYNLGLFGYALQGILINGFNPFTIILWVGILASVMAEHQYKTNDFLLFAIGVLGVVVSSDMLKAFLANKIAKVLNERLLQIADRILGVVFIFLSIRFFYFFAENYQKLFLSLILNPSVILN